MAKLVSIAAKTFRALLSRAESNRAHDLVYTIRKMAKPGKDGRMVVPKNQFNNLMRAAGPLTKRQHELMGKARVRGENEVRALRGGEPRTDAELTAIGRVRKGLPAYPGQGSRQKRKNSEALREESKEQGEFHQAVRQVYLDQQRRITGKGKVPGPAPKQGPPRLVRPKRSGSVRQMSKSERRAMRLGERDEGTALLRFLKDEGG